MKCEMNYGFVQHMEVEIPKGDRFSIQEFVKSVANAWIKYAFKIFTIPDDEKKATEFLTSSLGAEHARIAMFQWFRKSIKYELDPTEERALNSDTLWKFNILRIRGWTISKAIQKCLIDAVFKNNN